MLTRQLYGLIPGRTYVMRFYARRLISPGSIKVSLADSTSIRPIDQLPDDRWAQIALSYTATSVNSLTIEALETSGSYSGADFALTGFSLQDASAASFAEPPTLVCELDLAPIGKVSNSQTGRCLLEVSLVASLGGCTDIWTVLSRAGIPYVSLLNNRTQRCLGATAEGLKLLECALPLAAGQQAFMLARHPGRDFAIYPHPPGVATDCLTDTGIALSILPCSLANRSTLKNQDWNTDVPLVATSVADDDDAGPQRTPLGVGVVTVFAKGKPDYLGITATATKVAGVPIVVSCAHCLRAAKNNSDPDVWFTPNFRWIPGRAIYAPFGTYKVVNSNTRLAPQYRVGENEIVDVAFAEIVGPFSTRVDPNSGKPYGGPEMLFGASPADANGPAVSFRRSYSRDDPVHLRSYGHPFNIRDGSRRILCQGPGKSTAGPTLTFFCGSSRGASGGPVLDGAGAVVGINRNELPEGAIQAYAPGGNEERLFEAVKARVAK